MPSGCARECGFGAIPYGRVCRCGAGAAVGQCSCGRGGVVWRRSRTRARSRMALKPSIAGGLYPARHPLACALDRRLPRSQFRLARKRNAAARVARSHLTRDCAARVSRDSLIRSSPRGAPRDSKSAFTRVCDALCVAGTPLRGPRVTVCGPWIPASAGMSGVCCAVGTVSLRLRHDPMRGSPWPRPSAGIWRRPDVGLTLIIR